MTKFFSQALFWFEVFKNKKNSFFCCNHLSLCEARVPCPGPDFVLISTHGFLVKCQPISVECFAGSILCIYRIGIFVGFFKSHFLLGRASKTSSKSDESSKTWRWSNQEYRLVSEDVLQEQHRLVNVHRK